MRNEKLVSGKFHKRLLLAASVLFLIFSGCDDELENLQKLSNNAIELSEGMGGISLGLVEKGRTIFPKTPEFSQYAIRLQYLSGDANEINEIVASLPYNKELLPGVWRVTVTGNVYIEGVEGLFDDHYPAAAGSEEIDIKAGISTPVTIDLNRGDIGAKGVFRYEIGLPKENVINANLRILRINKTEVLSRDLLLSESGAFTLDEGYYFVQVRIFSGRLRSKTELMHINSGHTTIADGISWNFDMEEGVYLNLNELSSFLVSTPVNTADNPYPIKLLMDFESLSNSNEFLGRLFSVLNGRYVNVDLSETINVVDFGETTSYSANRNGLVSIILPDGLTQIGGSNFKDCSSLKEINIPEKIQVIGNSAFSNCTSLKNVILPNSILTIGNSSFSNCSLLEQINFTSSISSIGISAFSNTALQIVDLSVCFSMTELAGNVFSNCNVLETVVLSKSLTTINNSAFYRCTILTTVDFSECTTLKSIGTSAFKDCISLTSIIVPDSVTNIGSAAFEGCTSLTSITIPFFGTYFGYIFGASNYSNQNQSIPKSLDTVMITNDNSIPSYVFYNCDSLINITITDSVTSIGNSAFYGCSSLTSITIPDNVVSIGTNAFYGSSLTNITIPKSVTSIAPSALSKCSDLMSIIVKSGNTKYRSEGNCLIQISNNSLIIGCKNSLIPSSVTSIGEYAFSNCISLTSIVIPNSVTSIGEYAFSNCLGLTGIMIPDSVTNIGRSVFSNCNSLANITIPFIGNILNGTTDTHFGYIFGAINASNQNSSIPTSLKSVIITKSNSIPSNAFYVCSGITSITIPSSVTSIGEYAFFNCSGLTSITIPNGVTSIGYSAYLGCNSLTSVTIPFTGNTLNGVTNTHFSYIFGEINASNQNSLVPTSLKSVIITDGTSIQSSVFNGCSNITSITLPDSVINIDPSAFFDCVELSSIIVGNNNTKYRSEGNCLIQKSDNSLILGCKSSIIPSSVTSIGEYAFFNCSGLTNITIPESVKSIGNSAFSGCKGLTSIIIPDSVISIGSNTFSNCNKLKSITISNSIASISDSAFAGCSSLTSIMIPVSVTEIGNSAFSGCSNLTSITIPNSVTSISMSAFSVCSGLTSITIPFVGNKLNGNTNNHFGYIFGALNYSSQNSSIPASLKTVIITGGNGISSNAFSGCSSLTSITLPNSVTSIGDNAFYACRGLTGITIPNSVTIINISAFSGCSGLTSITIPFIGNTLNGTTNNHFGYIFGATSYSSQNSSIPSSLKSVVITGGNNIHDYAFYNCSSLTSITLPNSVTSIGDNVFSGCNGLNSIIVDIYNSIYASQDGILYNKMKTQIIYIPKAIKGSITIPDTITSIGDNIFSGCSGLTSITIPDSVMSIGFEAFSGCSNLTSITIPFVGNTLNGTLNKHFGYIFGASNYSSQNSSIPVSLKTVNLTGGDSIPNNAFHNSSSLTTITISDSVKSIGSSAFEGCRGLTNIKIPYSVESIAGYAFYDCSGLTNITIPESVISIGSYAFYGCSSLISITIPFVGSTLDGTTNTFFGYIFGASSSSSQNSSIPISLKTVVITGGNNISNNAFSNCNSLTNITIGDNVMSIGNSAFNGCSGLTNITIGNDVKSIGNTAFYGCISLTNVIIPGSVSSIGQSTFLGCSGLKNVTITDGVTSISHQMFQGCTSLTEITIPNSVTSIYSAAFNGCNNLTSISIPFVGNTLDGITNTHFGYIFGAPNYSNQNSYIPESLKTVIITGGNNIAGYAFTGCNGVMNITINSTSIDYYAFQYCNSLTSVTIGNNVTNIGGYVFRGCENLTSVTIGNNVTNIGIGTFFGCNSLTSITIPSSVTSIGGEIFSGCSSLISITIPDSVTSIGSSAFSNCSGLTSITIPKSVMSIGNYAFSNCRALTSITIPDSVTSIGNYAFAGCSSMTSVTLSNSITSIEANTFDACSSLTSITIPDSVTKINNYAFRNCTNLVSVTLGTITSENFSTTVPFPGNLRTVYFAASGRAGRYTRVLGSDSWARN